MPYGNSVGQIAPVPAHFLAGLNVVLRDQAVQVLATDPRFPGGFGDISAGP